jgi:hypothetical protein
MIGISACGMCCSRLSRAGPAQWASYVSGGNVAQCPLTAYMRQRGALYDQHFVFRAPATAGGAVDPAVAPSGVVEPVGQLLASLGGREVTELVRF